MRIRIRVGSVVPTASATDLPLAAIHSGGEDRAERHDLMSQERLR